MQSITTKGHDKSRDVWEFKTPDGQVITLEPPKLGDPNPQAYLDDFMSKLERLYPYLGFRPAIIACQNSERQGTVAEAFIRVTDYLTAGVAFEQNVGATYDPAATMRWGHNDVIPQAMGFLADFVAESSAIATVPNKVESNRDWQTRYNTQKQRLQVGTTERDQDLTAIMWGLALWWPPEEYAQVVSTLRKTDAARATQLLRRALNWETFQLHAVTTNKFPTTLVFTNGAAGDENLYITNLAVSGGASDRSARSISQGLIGEPWTDSGAYASVVTEARIWCACAIPGTDIVLAAGVDTGDPGLFIQRSIDLSANWSQIAAGGVAGQVARSMFYDQDSDVVVVVGDNGAVRRSVDQGAIFTLPTLPVATPDFTSVVKGRGNKPWIAVADGGTIWSSPTGAIWTEVDTSALTPIDLRTVVYDDHAGVYIAAGTGDDAWVSKTGAIWESQFVLTGLDACGLATDNLGTRVIFVDLGSGMVPDNGIVYASRQDFTTLYKADKLANFIPADATDAVKYLNNRFFVLDGTAGNCRLAFSERIDSVTK